MQLSQICTIKVQKKKFVIENTIILQNQLNEITVHLPYPYPLFSFSGQKINGFSASQLNFLMS